MIELADTSAWTNRHKDPLVEAAFEERLVSGRLAICPMVVFELLWSARSAAEFRELRVWFESLPAAEIGRAVWERALDVWQRVADDGRLRQVPPADYLVAAAAEVAGLGLCHYDADFELIASVTGQPVRAIAPLGSL